MNKSVIAIASGKGGTGKTTAAVNLAAVAPFNVTLLDCDVEEPNAHLFLKPEWKHRERYCVLIPGFDMAKCNACGDCRAKCRFNAIVIIKGEPRVFTELCHPCGVCSMICPEDAIAEIPREIGIIETGSWKHVTFAHGILDVGEAKSPPLMQGVKGYASKNGLTIIDCPPGTACPAVESVRGADYVLLVTEPTPFGLNDLALAVEMTRALDIPFGILINKAGTGDDRVAEYCGRENIPILAEVPFDRGFAEICSRGDLVVEASPEFREVFSRLLERLMKEAGA